MLAEENEKMQWVKCFALNAPQLKRALLDWFNKKYSIQFLKINSFVKMQYERNNSVNWRNDKCVICKMPLRVERINFKTPGDEMTWGDFLICFEHKFIRMLL